MVADSGQGDGGHDGFGQVVHCAEFQATQFFFGFTERGHEDHRDVVGSGLGAQDLECLVAIHARHHHIQQDEVWRISFVGDAQGFFTGGGGTDLVKGLQQRGEHAEVVRVIIDDQDSMFFSILHIAQISFRFPMLLRTSSARSKSNASMRRASGG